MHRLCVMSMALVFAASCNGITAELQSGLQVGESAGAFDVKDITGPNQGNTLCYR
jgi:hypothetical protein